jgi:REP element-mobilizing transposase RayT
MNLPKRKMNRVQNYDYSSSGAYFITVCTQNHAQILSNIVGEGSPLPQLTTHGKITEKIILSVNQKYPTVTVDKYVIMPNHIHIIFVIDSNGMGNPSPTISTVMGWLKYNITKTINQYLGNSGNKIFQRSFYDHVIRNEKDYIKHYNYIETNPLLWEREKDEH